MKKKIEENDESQDYMDSGDFMVSQVSESGFSQSFRSKDPTAGVTRSNQKPT
jgi:hypothetical protein